VSHPTDRVEEADVQTQTDAFLNRPATPLFVPAKTGADVATQIEEGDVCIALHICWTYQCNFVSLFSCLILT